MEVRTSVRGERGLPRYFSQVFDMARAADFGRLDITLPDGRIFRAEGARPGPVATVAVHDPDLFARMIREGDLGFSEAYLDGAWSTPDLQSFMDWVHVAGDSLVNGFPGQRVVRVWERLRFWLQSNRKRQAKKNIAHHYDLGNEFYALWLDDTMTYSSARFESGQESLEAAQRAKYASIVDRMGVREGDHVLEIGCGWGGFAEYAAGERGLRVTGLTISRAQHDYAVARMAQAGLADRVDIQLRDYRDERGRYDGVASIEMFEAVGQRYWPVYFEALRDRLKPGRSATLQVITVADAQWDVYRRGVDFIQKFIFPGGMLPSPSVLRQEIARAGLSVAGSVEFGACYSTTLRRWHESFTARWDEIERLGFDARFRRMWDYYLTSCAATFSSGMCDVTQITVTRPT